VGEVQDPRREFGVGGLNAAAVDFEEREHRNEREAFVCVDEGLDFGDAVGESAAACSARSAPW
jgi:hypothetical protein